MFNRKTVFIVGAGGSRELGLPMGDQLKSEIANRIDIRFSDGYKQSSGDRGITDAIRKHVSNVGGRDINPYLHAGWSISAAMPQAISIDNFLHTHADDEKIVLMGKLGIVTSILAAERSSSVFTKQYEKADFSRIKPSWHGTFTKMLLEGVQKKDLEAVFENVSFITFNYDRCIEYYLSNSIANYFIIDINTAREIVDRLVVIHPYGRVGRLPWQSGNAASVEFGLDIHSSRMLEVVSQVRVFTEKVEDEAVVKAMRDLLAEAELIVYLGFSYGAINIELLSLQEVPRPKTILGTAYGISKPNIDAIAHDLRNSMGPKPEVVRGVELASMTCDDMLNAYWRPIIR